ncbi:unnamed protein product [Taenia asiatica]|uniref:Uncharacterized protein n=1 Tax=Taenia asiatica TaxID=60517 RepID=A0A0R3W657_TAEAS|nr:unnamed protein product [Taenia asiatica]
MNTSPNYCLQPSTPSPLLIPSPPLPLLLSPSLSLSPISLLSVPANFGFNASSRWLNTTWKRYTRTQSINTTRALRFSEAIDNDSHSGAEHFFFFFFFFFLAIKTDRSPARLQILVDVF